MALAAFFTNKHPQTANNDFLGVCWHLLAHSIITRLHSILPRSSFAGLGCLIIRQTWLPRNFGGTFAKACQGHAMNFSGRVRANGTADR